MSYAESLKGVGKNAVGFNENNDHEAKRVFKKSWEQASIIMYGAELE